MNNLKCASFFAGVGGIDLGFQKNGFKTVYANEINTKAIQTYEANSKIKVDARDIHDVKTEEIPDFDIMLAGFPCQPFSVAGEREGFNDKKGRGNLFFELMRIIRKKKPEIIFLENVKGLVNHDKGRTFEIIQKELKSENYYLKFQIMNTCKYGNLPQNRERVYIVAFKNYNTYLNFKFPEEIERTVSLQDVIDFDTQIENKYYYNQNNFKQFDLLKKEVINNNTVYQWRRQYVRENKNGVCPTLTNNMGTGGHNVPIVLTKYGIRKITPRECFNLQGFPSDFVFPEQMSNTNLYCQAGNSVSVSVIERIAKNIKVALENTVY